MKYILGNWKLYLTNDQSTQLAQELSAVSFDSEKLTVGVFPNMLSLLPVQWVLRESSIFVGAQHVGHTPLGAYTGEVSAHVCAAANVRHVLVGHSERRHMFGEDIETTVKQMQACFDEGITPVLCVGETAEDVEAGKVEYRLRRQLIPILESIDSIKDKPWLIAYEPVWAISSGGVGTPCPPVDALERHNAIRAICSEYGVDVPVLYGGSVGEGNIEAYVTTPGVDGVLVGHASINGAEFRSMVEKMDGVV